MEVGTLFEDECNKLVLLLCNKKLLSFLSNDFES